MIEPPEDIRSRLLFILHRAFVEMRSLARRKDSGQVFALADAMELIPGMLRNWNDGDLEQVRSLLATYQNQYSGGFDFLARLDDQEPLPF